MDATILESAPVSLRTSESRERKGFTVFVLDRPAQCYRIVKGRNSLFGIAHIGPKETGFGKDHYFAISAARDPIQLKRLAVVAQRFRLVPQIGVSLTHLRLQGSFQLQSP